MIRRSHKKSRDGCTQCKGRHIKCDEGRPACLMCSMSGRTCSFTPSRLDASPAAHSRSISPGITATSSSLSPDAAEGIPANDAVNFAHMELMGHFMRFDMFFDMELVDYARTASFVLSEGLKWPFLMHQMLALSARHLAYLQPDAATSYLRQAMDMQTRALSLFNTSWKQVNESNCLALLIFSTLLGYQLLADALTARGAGLDAFLERFLQCIETHRGVHAIAESAWPLLLESELQPVLSWSADFTSREPRGRQCQELLDLVQTSDALTPAEKEASRCAVGYLQVGFDAILDRAHEKGNRHQMVLSWLTLLPDQVKNMLAAKRPEALIMLAYYALLLHYSRGLWLVNDAGRYVLDLVAGHLPEWQPWLELPRQKIAEDA